MAHNTDTIDRLAEIMAQRDTLPMVDGSRQKITPRELWRCTYGGEPGTVRTLPPQYPSGPVRLWFTYDRDPGFGPMSFYPGAGVVLVERIAPWA